MYIVVVNASRMCDVPYAFQLLVCATHTIRYASSVPSSNRRCTHDRGGGGAFAAATTKYIIIQILYVCVCAATKKANQWNGTHLAYITCIVVMLQELLCKQNKKLL